MTSNGSKQLSLLDSVVLGSKLPRRLSLQHFCLPLQCPVNLCLKCCHKPCRTLLVNMILISSLHLELGITLAITYCKIPSHGGLSAVFPKLFLQHSSWPTCSSQWYNPSPCCPCVWWIPVCLWQRCGWPVCLVVNSLNSNNTIQVVHLCCFYFFTNLDLEKHLLHLFICSFTFILHHLAHHSIWIPGFSIILVNSRSFHLLFCNDHLSFTYFSAPTWPLSLLYQLID